MTPLEIILIAVDILGTGCVVVVLAACKAGALEDQQRARLLSGRATSEVGSGVRESGADGSGTVVSTSTPGAVHPSGTAPGDPPLDLDHIWSTAADALHADSQHEGDWRDGVCACDDDAAVVLKAAKVEQLMEQVQRTAEQRDAAQARYLKLTRKTLRFELAVHNAWMARDLAAVGYALTRFHEEEVDADARS